MAHETVRRCAISADRISAREWHDHADRLNIDLVAVVRDVLTVETTRGLPSEWQGDFDHERAGRWIEARDAESPTLLVVERAADRPLGFVILFETSVDTEPARLDVRIGYVLAEEEWGKGLGAELVSGLVGWAWEEPAVVTLTAGVAASNLASARVLRKSGFERSESGDDEHIYRLDVA